MPKSKRLAIDIETDALNATRIWCISVYDIDTDENYIFTDTEMFPSDLFSEFKELIKDEVTNNSIFILHNGISFDLPILRRLLGVEIPLHNIRDTLVMSRLACQEREGGHSLENWGKILGFPKGDYTDFAGGLTREMVSYCVNDTRLTGLVYKQLLKELKDFSMKSLRIELETEYILQRMSERGYSLDLDFATNLLTDINTLLNATAIKLITDSPKLPKPDRLLKVAKKYLKDGKTLSSLVTKPLGEQANYLQGDSTLIDWITFNPGSRDQVAWQLMLKGWKPRKFTETGKPQVDEEVLDGIGDEIPAAKDLQEYFMLVKRRAQVQSWLDLYNPTTKRVHGRIRHIGARTHRAAHFDPNMAQIPASRYDERGSVLWGLQGTFSADCRKCWVPAPGLVQVGVDASAIQLVILAHAMGDEEYSKAVAFGKKSEGTDVHTVNRNVLRGIVKEAFKEELMRKYGYR